MVNELISNKLMEAQYGHLPKEEWPSGGPIIDVTAVLRLNASDVSKLESRIRGKRIATTNWVEKKFPGRTAYFLTRPFWWQNAEEKTQRLAAEWMSEIILAVYGDGYPLPNKHPDFNLDGIRNGTLLPYFGVIGPKRITELEELKGEELYKFIQTNQEEVIPVTTSALILTDNGFAELGRNANRGSNDKMFSGFEGGPTTLERLFDWLRNRHRLLERVHTLVSDMRAAQPHDNSPSSAAVQTLLLRDLGMRIRLVAPLYNVNGFEPFLSVIRPRNPNHWKETNRMKIIYTCSGPHISFLKKLWQHQVGEELNLQIIDDVQYLSPHPLGFVKYHGSDIYSFIDVYDKEKRKKLSQEEIRSLSTLDKSIADLDEKAPVIIVRVEAETPQSAITQRKLTEDGFVICGIEGGYDENYLNGNNEELIIRRYKAPAYIYLAKLGKSVKEGQIVLSPALFIDPSISGEKNGYDDELFGMLYEVDARIRQAI